MKLPTLFACLMLAACSAAPPAAPPPLVQRTRLAVKLLLVPTPQGEWEFEAKAESGAVENKKGHGEMVEVQLPPGPSALKLTADGMVYERPLVLGKVGATEVWHLVGGRRLQ